MFPFTRLTPIDSTERKALLGAVVGSLLFITLVMCVGPSNDTSRVGVPRYKKVVVSEPLPLPPVSSADSFAEYRIKPRDFYGFDFWNYSYGVYTSRDGKQKIPLTLVNSDLKLPNDSFSLKDVYYRDVTGDGEPEAIVWLSHVHCSDSCDGGSNLFYIYAVQDHKLKPVWQFETGSYAYGCGLKSLTISGRKTVVELFGHCTAGMEDPGATKFKASGLTYMLLEFDGRGYRQTSSEIVETPETTVKNYEAAVLIY